MNFSLFSFPRIDGAITSGLESWCDYVDVVLHSLSPLLSPLDIKNLPGFLLDPDFPSQGHKKAEE